MPIFKNNLCYIKSKKNIRSRDLKIPKTSDEARGDGGTRAIFNLRIEFGNRRPWLFVNYLLNLLFMRIGCRI